eukprot:365718-Chlamydomonas_euryale.AAC.21
MLGAGLWVLDTGLRAGCWADAGCWVHCAGRWAAAGCWMLGAVCTVGARTCAPVCVCVCVRSCLLPPEHDAPWCAPALSVSLVRAHASSGHGALIPGQRAHMRMGHSTLCLKVVRLAKLACWGTGCVGLPPCFLPRVFWQTATTSRH